MTDYLDPFKAARLALLDARYEATDPYIVEQLDRMRLDLWTLTLIVNMEKKEPTDDKEH